MVHGSEESLFQEPVAPADSYEIDKKFEMVSTVTPAASTTPISLQ